MATTQQFWGKTVEGSAALSTTITTITTGQAGDSALYALHLVNASATAARTVTFYDDAGTVIATVDLPAKAGTDKSVIAVDVLNTRLLSGTEYDAFGNLIYMLEANKTIKAKVDSTAEASYVFWKRKDK